MWLELCCYKRRCGSTFTTWPPLSTSDLLLLFNSRSIKLIFSTLHHGQQNSTSHIQQFFGFSKDSSFLFCLCCCIWELGSNGWINKGPSIQFQITKVIPHVHPIGLDARHPTWSEGVMLSPMSHNNQPILSINNSIDQLLHNLIQRGMLSP